MRYWKAAKNTRRSVEVSCTYVALKTTEITILPSCSIQRNVSLGVFSLLDDTVYRVSSFSFIEWTILSQFTVDEN